MTPGPESPVSGLHEHILAADRSYCNAHMDTPHKLLVNQSPFEHEQDCPLAYWTSHATK